MPQPREVTIYDLAEQLNISPATVSRALNNHPAISNKTKKKISDLASQLGYRANTFASNLRRQRTNTIGVIVQRLNSYFLANALAGIEKVANEAGYNIIISQSFESVKKEEANARTMFKSRVDGLIVSLSWDTENIDHLQDFLNKEIPVAFFDRAHQDERCFSVVIDNYKHSYEITTHMINQGCKRIVHVGGSQKRNVYADRLNGYKDALKNAGIPYDEELVIINDLTAEAGVAAADYILNMSKKPDAVFASADICAASCMAVLKENGIKVPEDISIAGFNNDPITRMTEPRITTVNNPGFLMGEIVANHLINHLNGVSALKANQQIIVDSEVIYRGSTNRMGQ